MPVTRPWDFQRSVVRQIYNKEIYNWFKDLDPEQLLLPDNPDGRTSALSACVIGAKDSIQVVLLKVLLFERLKQSITLLPKVTGETYDDIDQNYEHRPLITLSFLQDLAAVPDGFRAVRGYVSFRLINETSDTITEQKLRDVAVRIRDNFGLDGGFIWRKGKNKVTYRDKSNGLLLNVLCLTEQDGLEVVERMCNAAGQQYDPNKFQFVEPNRPSLTAPQGTDQILGKTVQARQWRPTVNVRFLYATAKISGLNNPVVLVDRSKQYFQAYEFL